MKFINKNKAILTALMIIFLAGDNASAGLGKKLKGKIKDAKTSVGTGLKSINAGDSLLHMTIRSGDVERIKEICFEYNNDPEIINAQNLNGETPLMLAFLLDSTKYTDQQTKIIDFLINQAKADVNIPDENGNSIFHRILTMKYAPSDIGIIYLLMAGVNVNAINNKNESILDAFLSIKDGRDGNEKVFGKDDSAKLVIYCNAITLLRFCMQRWNVLLYNYLAIQQQRIREIEKNDSHNEKINALENLDYFKAMEVINAIDRKIDNPNKEFKTEDMVKTLVINILNDKITLKNFLDERNNNLKKYQLYDQIKEIQ